MKQKLFQLLQESGIPATDKIFPWVVETALTRIEIASLQAKLTQTDSNLAIHPEQLKNSLELVLRPYLSEVGRTRIASDKPGSSGCMWSTCFPVFAHSLKKQLTGCEASYRDTEIH